MEEKGKRTRPENGQNGALLCARKSSEAFDVDGMLGRLAKWLRILGFDAEYPVAGPRTGRVYITRKTSCPDAVRVLSDDPLEQLKQVFDQVGVEPDPDLFLNRCLVCNEAVLPIARHEVLERVPPAVSAITDRFNECPRCGRIYWEGTHARRMRSRLRSGGIEIDSSAREPEEA